MKKSDLRTGMIVETRDGREYIVFIGSCKTEFIAATYSGYGGYPKT